MKAPIKGYLSVDGVVTALLLRGVALFLLLGVVVDVWRAIWRHRRTHTDRLKQRRTRDGGDQRALTGHLCFGSLVVDGLARERVDADLGDGQGGVLQLTVEPQHLSPFAGVLHHLKPRWPTGNE